MSGATAAKNDTDILYVILRSVEPKWIQHDAILRHCYFEHDHGMTVHSRAADLRKRGFTVECKVERHNGRARSFYRLVSPQ